MAVLARRAAALASIAVLWWTVGLGYGWGRAHEPPTREEAIEKLRELGRVEPHLDSPGLWVKLMGRQVTDSTLELLIVLTDVNRLTLTDTRVTEAGLAKLQCLPRLRTLIIDGAELTDRGLVEVAQLKGLEGLGLLDTRIEGTGLGYLEGLPRLDNLYLEGPVRTASGLADLGRLKGLLLIDVRLTDRDLTFLKSLPNLEWLSIEGDSLTLQGLDDLTAQQHLKHLYLGVRSTMEELERFRLAHPGIAIPIAMCGTPGAVRHNELAERRLRRQGLTGRLRLAWRDFLR